MNFEAWCGSLGEEFQARAEVDVELNRRSKKKGFDSGFVGVLTVGALIVRLAQLAIRLNQTKTTSTQLIEALQTEAASATRITDEMRSKIIERIVLQLTGSSEAEGADQDEMIFANGRFCIFTENSSLEDAQELYEKAKAFYEALGFSIEEEKDWVRGFLWKEAVARLKGLLHSRELGDRARVAENVLLGECDRDTTIALTKAIVDLENAFKGKKGAIAIDLGLFIFLRKHSPDGDGDIYCKRLTIEERALLNSDPVLIRKPERLFSLIRGVQKIRAEGPCATLKKN